MRPLARTTRHRTNKTNCIVHRGHGVLMVEEERFPFVAGDVLFVPANALHRFVEFSDDFVTWAVFWGPDGGELPQASAS
ncbi:cupin domain-containing protein [Granulicella sp. L46]|uniref:cupin domain-containing protein n=1 Tax=Granulicella sp. L46 TaxID=1641865 RepID=UPI003528932E